MKTQTLIFVLALTIGLTLAAPMDTTQKTLNAVTGGNAQMNECNDVCTNQGDKFKISCYEKCVGCIPGPAGLLNTPNSPGCPGTCSLYCEDCVKCHSGDHEEEPDHEEDQCGAQCTNQGADKIQCYGTCDACVDDDENTICPEACSVCENCIQCHADNEVHDHSDPCEAQCTDLGMDDISCYDEEDCMTEGCVDGDDGTPCPDACDICTDCYQCHSDQDHEEDHGDPCEDQCTQQGDAKITCYEQQECMVEGCIDADESTPCPETCDVCANCFQCHQGVQDDPCEPECTLQGDDEISCYETCGACYDEDESTPCPDACFVCGGCISCHEEQEAMHHD